MPTKYSWVIVARMTIHPTDQQVTCAKANQWFDTRDLCIRSLATFLVTESFDYPDLSTVYVRILAEVPYTSVAPELQFIDTSDTDSIGSVGQTSDRDPCSGSEIDIFGLCMSFSVQCF